MAGETIESLAGSGCGVRRRLLAMIQFQVDGSLEPAIDSLGFEHVFNLITQFPSDG